MGYFVLRADRTGTDHGTRLLEYIIGTGSGMGGHNHPPQSWTIDYDESGRALVQMKDSDEEAINSIAAGLADYILEQCEADLAGVLADRRYAFVEPNDRARAERFWLSFLNGDEAGDQLIRQRRRELVLNTLRSYLLESHYLDLSGFISFRLTLYKEMLQETIDLAMEEYLLDQQYEEFLQLLQYFVQFQEPLTPLVHLIHHGGQEFSIFNQSFSPIRESSSGMVVAKMGDLELEMEDQVVSTLISLSPDRILLHTVAPETTIISTIRTIFGNRVQLCQQCPHCNPVHTATGKRDQECHGGS